ncbi:MAG: hypothetical protein J6125_02855 [Clostridia bacterium]|nr:hypothetical protein [Clostridia bacterium]
MYLHVGSGETVKPEKIVGIFDLDNVTASSVSRAYLTRAEKEGRTRARPGELPKCFVLLAEPRRRKAGKRGPAAPRRQGEKDEIFFLRISSASLRARAENNDTATADLPF